MQSTHTRATAIASIICAVTAGGCSKDESKTGAAPSASASAATAPSAAPSAAASAATTTTTASATATASGAPRSDCPKDSSGEGTFAKPCEAKGKARMMEVAWTGKTDDKGPFFRVTNKSPHVILYGKIAVYFYDKAGKQLEVTDSAADPPKKVPYRTCSGNMFGGVMKVSEKAVLQFSCVKKEHVPEGTAAIEAEMLSVGFSDATEKKVDFYWSNPELAPDARKKGGAK
jgi:hypothetical protein